jgi:hypothetical protein
MTRTTRTAAGVAAAAVLAIGSAVAAGSARAAYTKACSPDTGAHVATADLHVNSSSIYGYSIYYHANSGWALGTHNNEYVYHTPGYSPWWASPDSGSPDVWINRDAMTNLNRPQEFTDIEAIFDHPNTGDPHCDMGWWNL